MVVDQFIKVSINKWLITLLNVTSYGILALLMYGVLPVDTKACGEVKLGSVIGLDRFG
jgi:hypothetical protein